MSEPRDKPGLVLQHGDLGPPGVFGDWLRERRVAAEVHHAWRDPLPDDPSAYAFVASLGSEHSAAAAEPAWVAAEVALLRRAVEADVPVLGLCFGGQALAVALGGEVGPADAPEVGWLPVESADPDLVPAGPWLMFHWEVFRPPPGVQEIARTDVAAQAFRVGPHLATQFHPEATPEIVDGWAHAEPRLAALGITPEALLAEGERAGPRAADQGRRLFDAWWAGVRAAAR